MSLGGGKKYSPPPDNSLELERMQQEERERSRVREEARAAQENERRRGEFSQRRDQAVNTARQRAASRIGSRGLNFDEFRDPIEQAIMGQLTRLPDLDPNPGQYFGDDLIDNTLNDVQQGRRAQFTRQVEGTFAPNIENQLFSDSADDPFIDAVLGRQRGEAMSALERAKKRGNLNESGFSSATARLGELEKAGRSTAQQLGGGVIQNYRKQVRDIADEARSAAGGYTLGGNFDVGSYQQRFDATKNDLMGRLEGDIATAVGGQNFFDIGDILTRGGNAQGAVNPRSSNLDMIAERDRVRNTNRGVGTGGTF